MMATGLQNLRRLFSLSHLPQPQSALCKRTFTRRVPTCPPVVTTNKENPPYIAYSQKRRYTQPHFPYPEIPSMEAARGFVVHLDDHGRTLLLDELNKIEAEKLDGKINQVSGRQLWEVFMFNGIPFIGFGILDNMIMIVAGEYIDLYIGALLGITTMAAAALGNLVSDVAGVGCAGYVEMIGTKLGAKPPKITPAQATQWQTHWAIGGGRAFGISLGCIIGMFPLLFFKNKKSGEDDEVEAVQSGTTNTGRSNASASCLVSEGNIPAKDKPAAENIRENKKT